MPRTNKIKTPRNWRWIPLIEDVLGRIKSIQLPGIAAQSAYYLILSVFPFLIVLVTLLDRTPFLQSDVIVTLLDVLPDAVKDIMLPLIDELSTNASTAPIAAMTGIWTASAGLVPVIRGLNQASQTEKSRGYLRNRLISIIFTVALILLIILVLLTQLIGPKVIAKALSLFGLSLTHSTGQAIIFQIITLTYMMVFFMLLHRYGASTRGKSAFTFKDLIPGALVSTLGINIASWGFRFYVNQFARYTVVYGSIAGIMILCIWFFLMSFVMILGGVVSISLQCINYNRFCLHEEDQVTIPLDKIRRITKS